MKQLDYETSNYKHKEDIKVFVESFNELADKYVKSFENSDGDLKKVNANIERKTATIEKLEASLVDLNNKTAELSSLKELSNEDIKDLNAKKSEISYTDSEVQKMELDDINSQITAKKGKIAKIDAKIDSTKAKIKANNEETKLNKKELSELEKNRAIEEEAFFRTQSLVSLVRELKEEMNTRALEIVNSPYQSQETEIKGEPESPQSYAESIVETLQDEPNMRHPLALDDLESKINVPVLEEDPIEDEISITDFEVEDTPTESIVLEEELTDTLVNEKEEAEDKKEETESVLEEVVNEKTTDKSEVTLDSLLEDKFKSEGLDVQKFCDDVKEKMNQNKDSVIKNMEILKKHEVPLEYTADQPEIYYDINSQDLDDLLSIITTDEDGNGMGFSIDFTFNILTELSHINVDKLIDVYNEEFMNVDAKSGIIHLLKLTDPSIGEFKKNREVNIGLLRDLGASTVDSIVEKHPEFVDMDNPLFVNVLNVFDKNDLVEKLNGDVDVVTKIVEYWRNN